ncbi:MAG: hypothetical protein MJK14_26030 [Rivularia sp. ALOHA_DT_140]|nr:hypothetical protein [Rivularia sp. ALOHA_DT_140]
MKTSYRGTFEAHITVKADNLLLRQEFTEICQKINVKCLFIQLPKGVTCSQLMFGWKLHGLVEQGIKRWRPKDLYDLMLFTSYVELDETLVKKSIFTAFNSRNTTFEEIYYILSTPEWWDRSKNRGKWKWYIRRQSEQNIEEDFLSIVDLVTQKWSDIVKEILDFSTKSTKKLYP